jgi:hypothetical protein
VGWVLVAVAAAAQDVGARAHYVSATRRQHDHDGNRRLVFPATVQVLLVEASLGSLMACSVEQFAPRRRWGFGNGGDGDSVDFTAHTDCCSAAIGAAGPEVHACAVSTRPRPWRSCTELPISMVATLAYARAGCTYRIALAPCSPAHRTPRHSQRASIAAHRPPRRV